MNSHLFIDRPILSGVISVIILLLGLLGLTQLPIEQFPDIAPPTISVRASYTGASAETLQKSVVVPLEEAINGVEHMLYMTSNANNNGSCNINVFFEQGTDPDMATVNVQNRVAQAQGLLPAEVTKTGVTVMRRQTSTLKSLGLYSPHDTYDQAFLNNYFKIEIEPRLSRVPGVGEVDVYGSNYSMRIWLHPDKMAQYGLVPSDITTVLGEQNIESPAGTLGAESENTYQYVLKYRGRYEDEEDFRNMVIRSLPDGTVLRLGDVARVEMGLQAYTIQNQINGHAGATCMIAQTPGSNANEIITQIDRLVEQIRTELPQDIELVDLMSTKDFLDASINSVVRTLIEAALLVIIVVLLFLRSWRSTLVPLVAIVVSLVGTFGFMYAVGFSLNTLTLFSLVLVIGTVVDDAIVVAEAVQTRLERGETDVRLAAIGAMNDVRLALITSTLVFMAVFIPVCFMGGTAGIFYTQFGLTMAVAVLISLINALTLSPALCRLLMKESTVHGYFQRPRSLPHKGKFRGVFPRLILHTFRHRYWVLAAVVVAACVFLHLLRTTKTSLVPNEDMGVIYVTVQTQPGSSMVQTRSMVDSIEPLICHLPQVKAYSKSIGMSRMAGQSANNGMFLLRLLGWDQRKGRGDDLQSVMDTVNARLAHITEAKIMVFTQPMITGYGATNGFELQVQDHQGGSIDSLMLHTDRLIAALKSRPEISRAQTSFDNRYPQYRVEIDAARCKRAGVSPSSVLSALSGFVGGSYASNFNKFNKLYRVMLQAEVDDRLDLQSLQNMFVRGDDGQMSPLSTFVTLTPIRGTATLNRFNMYNAIQVSGMPQSGYSTGQALQAVREEAARVLPDGYGYEFAGMSREEAEAGSNTLYVFALVVLFVYLILCALYESLVTPLAVILVVPFGLMGSFLFARCFGLENNIYMQTGVIMLIGLLAKTAILITEYAESGIHRGLSPVRATLSAARVRLRPILMTSLTMIFGLLPMVFATGAGANGNISLGVCTVGGMLVGTLALIGLLPALFVLVKRG